MSDYYCRPTTAQLAACATLLVTIGSLIGYVAAIRALEYERLLRRV